MLNENIQACGEGEQSISIGVMEDALIAALVPRRVLSLSFSTACAVAVLLSHLL